MKGNNFHRYYLQVYASSIKSIDTRWHEDLHEDLNNANCESTIHLLELVNEQGSRFRGPFSPESASFSLRMHYAGLTGTKVEPCNGIQNKCKGTSTTTTAAKTTTTTRNKNTCRTRIFPSREAAL